MIQHTTPASNDGAAALKQSIDDLAMHQACHDRVLRVTLCVDLGRFDELPQHFTADAVVSRPAGDPIRGREALRAAYLNRPPERLTRHLISHVVVDRLGPDQARVHSQVLVWAATLPPDAGPGVQRPQEQFIGEYDDLLRRESDGAWRIAERDSRFIFRLPIDPPA